MVRSVKSLWAPEMEPFQDDTDPEPIKVSSAEVLTPCVKWMLSRGWLLGSSKFLLPEIQRLPQIGELPSIHENWSSIEYLDTPETFVQACNTQEAVLYLGIIEMVVDESCLGQNVRQEIYKLWDLFRASVTSRGVWERTEPCFIFEWSEDSWSKL